jgi:hypothetical protein
MTDKFKKRVREHAKKHGMSYQAAHQQLFGKEEGGIQFRGPAASLYREATSIKFEKRPEFPPQKNRGDVKCPKCEQTYPWEGLDRANFVCPTKECGFLWIDPENATISGTGTVSSISVNQRWLQDNPGLKTVTLTLAHNEHGTPTVHVSGPELTPLQITQPPDAYVDAIRQAYMDHEWAKNPRDDLGDLPVCETRRPRKIIVNGREKETTLGTLTFGQVVCMAFENPSTSIEHLTVTYRGPSSMGSMFAAMAHPVPVEDGMIFNVTDTGNA